jgi:hypothetical protein
MSKTVDSSPIFVEPPFRIKSTFSPSPFNTCSALVGLKEPKGLALGAASAPVEREIKLWAASWSGNRIAAVASPAVASPGIFSFLGKIIERGPGQRFSARRKSLSLVLLLKLDKSATFSRVSMAAI